MRVWLGWMDRTPVGYGKEGYKLDNMILVYNIGPTCQTSGSVSVCSDDLM